MIVKLKRRDTMEEETNWYSSNMMFLKRKIDARDIETEYTILKCVLYRVNETNTNKYTK